MGNLDDIFQEIHRNGAVKCHEPWIDGNNSGGHHEKTKEALNIEICLNCKKKKCSGSCAQLSTYKYYPKKHRKK